MRKFILILSAGEDLNDDSLQVELEERGALVRRFVLGQDGYGFRYDIANDTWKVWGPDFELSESSISRIWLRSLASTHFHHNESSVSRAAKETSEAFNQFVKCLPSALFINKPSAIDWASEKARQLIAARKAGLLVPKSYLIYGNIQRFVYNKMVVKVLGEGIRLMDTNEFEMFPSIRVEDLLPLEDYFPGIIQEEIIREADVRIFFVRGRVIGIRINSSKQAEIVIDHRFHDVESLDVSFIDVPDGVSKAIEHLMRQLGVEISALDFILDKSGFLWFLEANTMGNWVWYDGLCACGVVDLIANELLK